MRRKDRAVQSQLEIEKIIDKAEVLRVAFSNNLQPYIVPVNFGYHENTFYFHCANRGKKLDMIQTNANVAFELEGSVELIKGDVPCEFTMAYESVVGTGKAEIINETPEKIVGLNHIMHHYTNTVALKYKKDLIDRIVIVKIEIDEISGKKSN